MKTKKSKTLSKTKIKQHNATLQHERQHLPRVLKFPAATAVSTMFMVGAVSFWANEDWMAHVVKAARVNLGMNMVG